MNLVPLQHRKHLVMLLVMLVDLAALALELRVLLKTAKGKRDAASRPDKKPPGQGGRPRKPEEPAPPKPAMKQIGELKSKDFFHQKEGRIELVDNCLLLLVLTQQRNQPLGNLLK